MRPYAAGTVGWGWSRGAQPKATIKPSNVRTKPSSPLEGVIELFARLTFQMSTRAASAPLSPYPRVRRSGRLEPNVQILCSEPALPTMT